MLGPTVCDVDAPEDISIGLPHNMHLVTEISALSARRRCYTTVKHCIEWIVALVLLVLTAPLLCGLALLVKITSRGPAIYAQTRLGQAGRHYRIYKLRTMRQDAEVHSGPVWCAKDDARVTRLGRLLRDTHLDELPQLWNVLKCDMALIGPRPERPEIAARIAARLPWFHYRLRVRPGVTGLAQMLLPADDPNDAELEGVRRKLAHDLLYIREISPLLDVKIALCTTCYFCGAAIRMLQSSLLRSYARMIEGRTMVPPITAELKQGAA